MLRTPAPLNGTLGCTDYVVDILSVLIPRSRELGVSVSVNGRALVDLVRETELPYANLEGSPSIAGAYRGLPEDVALLPSLHLLGEPNLGYTDGEGRPYILICPCEEPTCWSLSMRVTVAEGVVVWSDFKQEHRDPTHPDGPWVYHTMGPFSFERTKYEQALAASSRRAT